MLSLENKLSVYEVVYFAISAHKEVTSVTLSQIYTVYLCCMLFLYRHSPGPSYFKDTIWLELHR